MFYLRYLLLIFAVTLLEATVVPRISIGGIRPDIGFALVIYAGLSGGMKGGLLVGFVVGLLRGCADPGWLGLESLLLAGVGFAAGSTARSVNRGNPLVQTILLALLLLGHDLIRALVITSGAPGRALLYWLRVSPATALYTALLVPGVVALMPRVFLEDWRCHSPRK
ncbi:MAG: rod shape-determining protein MreD [Candidatus Eisenbacteria sp.]|nr:rod shape-determining protein MreD [Candidatus Eisenbacteria bacterium]